jgi:hypothetical protein
MPVEIWEKWNVIKISKVAVTAGHLFLCKVAMKFLMTHRIQFNGRHLGKFLGFDRRYCIVYLKRPHVLRDISLPKDGVRTDFLLISLFNTTGI